MFAVPLDLDVYFQVNTSSQQQQQHRQNNSTLIPPDAGKNDLSKALYLMASVTDGNSEICTSQETSKRIQVLLSFFS